MSSTPGGLGTGGGGQQRSRASSAHRADESALTNLSCITASQPVLAGVARDPMRKSGAFLNRVNSLHSLTPKPGTTPLLSARGASPPKRMLLLPPHSPSDRRKTGLSKSKPSGGGGGGPFKGNHLLSSFDNETPRPPRSSSRQRGGGVGEQGTTPRRTPGRRSGKGGARGGVGGADWKP